MVCSVIIMPNVIVGNTSVTLIEVDSISLNYILMTEVISSLIATIKVNKHPFT
jgi:hypothetical protein